MLSGPLRAGAVCQPSLGEPDEGRGAGGDGAGELGKRSVEDLRVGGLTKPVALPVFGPRAPKIAVEGILWSLGADGRRSGLAPRRGLVVFCPPRASFGHQTSTPLPSPSVVRRSFRRAGKLFLPAAQAASSWAYWRERTDRFA